MTKVKIEDLKAFPAVAAVIGEAKVKAELFKLQGVKCNFEDDKNAGAAFAWMYTPQGHGFWADICNGVNPYAK
ncbi:hypothetical protein [Vibrio phage vB_VaS_L1]|nr:hypothetical protein [Vibrio phage vB_VaS_L1]